MVPVEGPSQDASSPGYVIIDEAGGVTAVSASPTENVVAVGYRSGTVSVWLAAPSLTSDSTFEVFDFEAHRGSAISQLKFGPDGKTLITSDAIGVQFGWVSEPAK